MFQAEIISHTAIDPLFHTYCEQITGNNSATIVQKNKRMRADKGLPLAYFEAFANPEGEVFDVKHLLGMLHLGVLVCGEGYDFEFVLSQPHGLHCLMGHQRRNGPVGVLFTGNGDQWETALRNAGRAQHVEVQTWGRACHAALAKHNLDQIIGRIKPGTNEQYLLE